MGYLLGSASREVTAPECARPAAPRRGLLNEAGCPARGRGWHQT